MNIPVIYGSVRRARKGIHGARIVVRMLEDRGHEVSLIDPLEYPLPLLDRMYKEYDPGDAPGNSWTRSSGTPRRWPRSETKRACLTPELRASGDRVSGGQWSRRPGSQRPAGR